MVKLHGGAIGREEGYGTGVIVSSEGWVVTPLTLLVEGANIRAVTYDGHIYSAETAYRDAYRQLALLKLARRAENVDTAAPVREQMASATFTPLAAGDASDVRSGEWILAVGNPFKVAGGEEPLSVMRGVVAGRRPLDATRRTGESLPYRGDVILFDVITSNPGAPGGALVDLQGRWLGLVGKEAWSRQTNTRLNYAYPIEEIHAFYEQARAGADVATRPASIDAPPGYHGIRLSMIGYRKRLPFVQSVEAGSPAALAGVRPDDMIVSANGVAIPRVRVFDELCEDLHAGDELVLVIRRGEQLISLRLTLTESPMK
jgi:serine protease Do